MLGLGLGITKTAGLRSLAQKLLSILRGRATYYENGAASKEEIQTISDYELLDKATILLTPTAISDARVHSVKTYTGDELVTNGTFSTSDLSSFSSIYATISIDNEKLKVVPNAGQNYGLARVTWNSQVGDVFLVKATAYTGNATSTTIKTHAGITIDNITKTDDNWTYEAYGVATSTQSIIRLQVNGADGVYGYFDNISVTNVSSDFDFDRASSATRINSSGLVQDMQSITDPELVLNGDFSEIDTTNAVSNPTFDLGDDVVTNGAFDTDSDWTKLNATISGGKGNLDGNGQTSLLWQDILTNGKSYKATFTVSDYNGSGSAKIINNNAGTIYTITSDGTFTTYFTHSIADGKFLIRALSGAVFSVDNVSVKEVTDWDEVPAGWSFDGNGATHASGNTGILKQYNVTVDDNKTWKVQLKVNNVTSGTVIFESGDRESIGYGEGTHEFYHKNTTGNTLGLKPSSDFVGTIEYVNVFEVDPNDRWSLGTGWSIGDGKLVGTSVATQFTQQSLTFTNGNTYKITFDITGADTLNNDTSFRLPYDGTVGNISYLEKDSPDGTYSHTFVAGTSSNLYLGYIDSGTYTGTIDNISVKDITFSTDVDLARINYDSNGENGHILLEPTSTNLITYSEDFSEWDLGSNATLSYESDVVAPDGSLGVYRLTLPATSSTFLLSNIFSGQNPLALSIYAKSASTNNNFNLYDGSNSSSLKTATSEWQRFDYVGNGTQLAVINSGDTFITDIYIWGAQAEALSHPTSYIPSLTGSTVTRATETLTGSGNSTLINSTEGVLYAEIEALDDRSSIAIGICDGSTEIIECLFYYRLK